MSAVKSAECFPEFSLEPPQINPKRSGLHQRCLPPSSDRSGVKWVLTNSQTSSINHLKPAMEAVLTAAEAMRPGERKACQALGFGRQPGGAF
jgi:hypothetical protein